MNIKLNIKQSLKISVLGIFLATNIFPIHLFQEASASSNKIVYPLQQISKLECRFTEFGQLKSNCKEDLPILKTKDYNKYAKQNGGYNKFTRLYTVLWGASYKYGWDVGSGGHIWTDFATAKGTPIYSIAEGTVIHAKNMGSLGLAVSVEHRINWKKIVSNYAHMSKILTKKGAKVKAGTKIGEVWSTGNSTGNHLHFQLDLDTPFHPYYYNYKACPYSYYKITEDGVCFNELQKNTIDPLLFLETNGSVLNNVKVETVSRPSKKPSKNNNSSSSKNSTSNMSIFNKTVYVGYSTSDIKEVQEIFRDLGEYKGSINWNYKDLEPSVISYQLAKRVIKSKWELGAGRFGPKTRAQVKKDYQKFLDKWGKPEREKVYITWNNSVSIKNTIKTKKISRKNMLSREEIEAREVKDFLKKYEVKLQFNKVWGNVPTNRTEVLKLSVTDKKRNKPFKWNMPWGMTFIVDKEKLNVFPQKLFYFTDGQRDIKLTGKKEWNTRLYIKIGNQTIKSFPIKVYNEGKTIYPASSTIQGTSSLVLGDAVSGIGLFKDSSGRKLINLPYGSSYKLKANADAKVCLKSGKLNNLQKIIKADCNDSEYKKVVDFKYENTIGWLVVYNVKATGKNPKVEIINNYKNKVLVTKNMRVANPKGLKNNYAYKKEVLAMLESGVVDGINKGYFLENRELKKQDAYAWVSNALDELKENAVSQNLQTKIVYNQIQVENAQKRVGKFETITREELLDLSYKYLVFKQENIANRNFLDLDDTTDKQVASVFHNTNTWKDKFGQKYFRPDQKITRGEAAYFLSNALQTNNQVFLTLR